MPHPPGTAASLAFGILAILLAWCPPLALPAVLVALVLSRRAAERGDPACPQGAVLAARVCALVGFGITLLVAALLWLLMQGIAAGMGAAQARPSAPLPGELLW